MATIEAQIRIRRDTAANFTSANPTLALGEIAYETDTRNIKVGDGATAWTALGYINPFRGGTAAAPTSNTVIGSGAGAALQSASASNTLIGNSAGAAITTGQDNVAVGLSALSMNLTGVRNTSVGQNAGLIHQSSDNTAIGSFALTKACGPHNTAVGVAALLDTTGTNNVAVGRDAALASAAFNNVTAIGRSAAQVNTASDITAVGANALDANTTGTNNTAVGKDALGANTTGASSVAIGNGALSAQTTAGTNTAVGHLAGQLCTSTANTFVGNQAGNGITTGDSNTCIGHVAGSAALGSSNTYVGSFAGDAAAASSGHTAAVGYAACFSQSSNNAALGASAGYLRADGTIGTGCTNSVFVGQDARPSGDSESNQIVIGYQGRGNGSNTTTIGNSSTTGTFIPAGNLTLTNGNFIVGTSGKGIDFSATANSSGTMTSELLSDYEEGTFTPTVSSGVTTPTYTTQTGWYTKIGRMVYFMVRIDLSGGTANASQLKFGGLPFTSNSNADLTGGGHWTYTSNLLAANTSALPHIYVANSSTTADLYSLSGNAFVGTDANSVLNAMTLQGFYFV